MRQYFFYTATGAIVSGAVGLQNPGVATSVGVAQDGKVYNLKIVDETAANKSLRDALIAAVIPGTTYSEAALIAAVVTALPGAKLFLTNSTGFNGFYPVN